mmetsp:Transcript_16882/g.21680  ORF Transcript_16882/g.21680 Transcript_16882/m.21680 type:complete len:344 (+) Transcript_16882:61-1092(+)
MFSSRFIWFLTKIVFLFLILNLCEMLKQINAFKFLSAPRSAAVNNGIKIFTSLAPRPKYLSTQNLSPQDLGGEDIVINVQNDVSIKRNSNENAVFFVSGASRGIGLQFVQELLNRTQGKVIAACRNPGSAVEVQKLLEENPDRVVPIELDLTDQNSIESAASAVKEKYNRVDCLFNVAGVLGDAKTTPGPERSLRAIQREWFQNTLELNTIGHVMLTQAMMPFLATKRSKDRAPSVVASISARVGSIGDNNLGGWYSYRISKAALNMATRTMALELRRNGTWVISLHPGTTDTDLSVPFQKNVKPEKLFTPQFTVTSLMNVVDSLEEKNTGGFYAYDGTSIPW